MVYSNQVAEVYNDFSNPSEVLIGEKPTMVHYMNSHNIQMRSNG